MEDTPNEGIWRGGVCGPWTREVTDFRGFLCPVSDRVVSVSDSNTTYLNPLVPVVDIVPGTKDGDWKC